MNKYPSPFVFFVIIFTLSLPQQSRATPSLPDGAAWIANHWSANSSQVPYRWRSSASAIPDLTKARRQINTIGLEHLFISGSTPLTLPNINWLKKTIHHPIYVIDLRQETHLYINGLPISIFYKRNAINWGKTTEQIKNSELHWVKYLSTKPMLPVNLYHQGQIKSGRDTNLSRTLRVKEILTEETFIKRNGFHYFRITVPDYHPPSPEQVDYFLSLERQIPAQSWLHVHCAGGKGRTSTFMVMSDILHNAQKVSLEDIVARQVYFGGIDLLSPDRASTDQVWKKSYHQARTDFIRLFYAYVRSQAIQQHTFQSWIKKQPDGKYKSILKTQAYLHP